MDGGGDCNDNWGEGSTAVRVGKRGSNQMLESSEDDFTEQDLGKEVEVQFKGEWYAGTLEGPAEQEMRYAARWRVQMNDDKKGILTYSKRIRRRTAGSRVRGGGRDRGDGTVRVSNKRTGRLRKIRAVQEQMTGKRSREETEATGDGDKSEKKSRKTVTETSLDVGAIRHESG